jgi:hypothetical protein
MDEFTAKQLIRLGEIQTELSLLLHSIENPGATTPVFKDEMVRRIYSRMVFMRVQIKELKSRK